MFLASCGLEHEKYMNTEEDTFVTYRKIRSRYTVDFEDIQLEDTNSDMDPTGIHSDGVKEREKMRTEWSFAT